MSVSRISGNEDSIRRLFAELMLQAVTDAKRGKGRDADDARRWLNDDREDVFSFRSACSVLDLDPGRVRKALWRR